MNAGSTCKTFAEDTIFSLILSYLPRQELYIKVVAWNICSAQCLWPFTTDMKKGLLQQKHPTKNIPGSTQMLSHTAREGASLGSKQRKDMCKSHWEENEKM